MVESIGQRIQQLRRQKGLTQQELARLSSISQGLLSHYELDHRQPGLKNLQKIAQALAVPLTELVSEAQQAVVQPASTKSPRTLPVYGWADLQEDPGIVFGGTPQYTLEWSEVVPDEQSYVVVIDDSFDKLGLKNGDQLIVSPQAMSDNGDLALLFEGDSRVSLGRVSVGSDNFTLNSLEGVREFPRRMLDELHSVILIKKR